MSENDTTIINAIQELRDCLESLRWEVSQEGNSEVRWETELPDTSSAWDELNYCQTASEIKDWMLLYESDLKCVPSRDKQ